MRTSRPGRFGSLVPMRNRPGGTSVRCIPTELARSTGMLSRPAHCCGLLRRPIAEGGDQQSLVGLGGGQASRLRFADRTDFDFAEFDFAGPRTGFFDHSSKPECALRKSSSTLHLLSDVVFPFTLTMMWFSWAVTSTVNHSPGWTSCSRLPNPRYVAPLTSSPTAQMLPVRVDLGFPCSRKSMR